MVMRAIWENAKDSLTRKNVQRYFVKRKTFESEISPWVIVKVLLSQQHLLDIPRRNDGRSFFLTLRCQLVRSITEASSREHVRESLFDFCAVFSHELLFTSCSRIKEHFGIISVVRFWSPTVVLTTNCENCNSSTSCTLPEWQIVIWAWGSGWCNEVDVRIPYLCISLSLLSVIKIFTFGRAIKWAFIPMKEKH